MKSIPIGRVRAVWGDAGLSRSASGKVRHGRVGQGNARFTNDGGWRPRLTGSIPASVNGKCGADEPGSVARGEFWQGTASQGKVHSMAGDWIKIENVTPDKPEVFAIAERMGIDPDAVTGKLVRIWIWADQQTITGDAASVTRASLDRLACVTGFANSMIDVGWLEETGNGLRFVHFDRHNGETAKQRALAAKRNAALRSRRNERDGDGVTSASPREEKRREEKSNTNTQDMSAGADRGEAATTTAITSTKPKSLIPDDDSDDEPPKAIKKAKPDSINPGDLVVAWNRCVGLAPITSMTANRKKSLRARSRDPIFRDNWQAAIQRVGTTDFCRGGGPQGWRADIDWFLRPDTIVKIMEGKYDDRDTNGNNGGSVPGHRGISSEEARLQRSLQACEDFARNG